MDPTSRKAGYNCGAAKPPSHLSKPTRATPRGGHAANQNRTASSSSAKAEVARSTQALHRLEEKELPKLDALAKQRYALAPADADAVPTSYADADTISGETTSTWSLLHGAANKTAISPRALEKKRKGRFDGVVGGGPATRPGQPLKEVKIPKTIRMLLAGPSHSSAAIAATEKVPLSPLRKSTAVIPSPLPPCFSERVGLLTNPLSNVRTAYQDEELRKRGPVSALPQRFLSAPPATANQNYLPLEDFDDKDSDPHTPEEWVAMGQGIGGTRARSRYHEESTTTVPATGSATAATTEAAADSSSAWAPCRVIAYDAEKASFQIRWERDGKTKWTRRLNIIFDGEDETAWQHRRERAERYRQEAEALIRQELYLQAMPNEVVTPFDQDRMDRVIAKVAKKFPLPFLHIVQQCSDEVEETYYRGVKKAIVEYDMRDVAEQQRLAAFKLPAAEPQPEPSLRGLCGTIDTPSPNFEAARTFLAANMFQTHALLHETLHAIHTMWFEYKARPVCLASFRGTAVSNTASHAAQGAVTTPLMLSRFVELQYQRGSSVSEKLRGEWSATVQSTIQNNLDPYFNFYEDNAERYAASRMHRFVSLVNTMMTTQLRELLTESLESYTNFICSFHARKPRHVQAIESGEANAERADESESVAEDTFMDELPEDTAEHAHWAAQREALRAKREKQELEQQQHQQPGGDGAKSGKGKKKNGNSGAAGELNATTTSTAAAGEDGDGSKEAPEPFAWRLGVHTSTIPYSQRVVDLTMRPNGLQPLFAVRLVEDFDGNVSFQPPLEEFDAQVKSVFERCFEYCSGVCGMGDQLFPLLDMKPTHLVPLDAETEPGVCAARARIAAVMAEAVEAPRQLQQMYKEFEYILKADVDAAVDEVVRENLSQDELDLVFDRITRDLQRIAERTPNHVKYELFSINCQDLKSTLTRKANALLTALQEVLAQRLAQDCAKVIQGYEAIHHRIAIEPTTPEELQELRVYLDGVPAQEAVIQTLFSSVTEGNELLLRYRYLVSEEDFVRYWLAYEWPKKLQQIIEDRNFRCKEHRTGFIQALRDNCDKLSYDIMHLAANVEDFSHLGDDARADEFYERAKEIQDLTAKYQAQVVLYNSHEELFGMAASQYPQLKEIKQTFEPYFTLWEIASLFTAETERWMNTRIAALQPVEVDQKITDWTKKVTLIAKRIKEPEPSEVAKRLRDNLERFKPNIPLLYALRSNLQASHWRAIYAACGVPKDRQGFGAGGVDNNDARPLADFLKLGMLDHMTAVESIAQVAQKTYELEAELMAMETEWKKLLFEMEPYQDTFKLKANEMMQLTLDEHILKTQSMLGKPIVRQAPALQARVSQWEHQLDNIQCTMDEWFRCQNTWAYLEPIFSSADISRSLPKEKQLFVEVDDNWHHIMEQTRGTPQVLTRCQDEGLFKILSEANETLEVVLRKLQMFLETKRMAFPRFYFISNEELLQILSDSKDPYLVQPYLCKCFEGIKRIQFADHHDIIGMTSAEGEEVPFIRKVNPSEHGNQVELWLQAVENVMRDSVRDQLRQAIGDYAGRKRVDFVRSWPGQVVIAICSLFWTMEATRAMEEEGTVGLTSYHEKCVSQLDELILLVRDKNLGVVQRCTLEALVVIEVHSKDIIGMLCEKGVDSPTSFDWLSQLRYYWEEDHLNVNQINASLRYGYEYLGNTGRLVITPLTDRCYRTLIGALHLNYGGAPEGPAGTGKTETTKDLAKALGKYCVVYNCSDQISAKDMAKLFKGLTQSGAWGCFDEFNRIEIQVLSVIAQQVSTIQEAIVQKRTEFIFEGAQIKLDSGCAIFITMNPGYAGRAELPDNLKALFRPVAMMVPNYAMIGEIQLYSYGFLHGKVLSEKIVATYRLCSEQLSSQDHYDYGMRAVKAVLTAAGRLKRAFPDEDEMILMLRSIQDVNLPKFLSQDVGLFKGIVSDLFPGVTLPEPDYVDMHAALETVCGRRNLQLTPYFEEKIRQTYEMICVRHGMMIVGFSYGGKTKALQSLSEALGEMETHGGKEHRTRLVTINPKSVTMSQLYGKVEQSGEWTDGILSNRFRQIAQDTSADRKWLILDGPVDAVWIENMNTVLDDNKKLCLQNGDIIPMSKTMNLIFEVQDLAHASPATVSRCGMVYVEPATLGWRCLMDSFMNRLPDCIADAEELVEMVRQLTDLLMEDVLEFARKHTKTVVPQGASTAVASFIKLFSSFGEELDEDAARERCGDADAHARCMRIRVEGWFLFSLVWSVGGCLFNRDRQKFNDALHELLAAKSAEYRFTLTLPEKTTNLYDVKLEDNLTEVRFATWHESVPELTIPDESEYQDIIVPTTETTKYSYLMKLMMSNLHPALLVGDTGTGKTIMVKALLKSLPEESYKLNLIQFSAQTTAAHLQRLVDGSCEKRRKGYYGPPINKKMMIFIDDANLPQLEEYGAQPPIELLRQYLDHDGWYNHSKDGIEFRHLVDVLLLCAMGPAGGGRNAITPRFTRHFNAFSVPSFDEGTLKTIFGRLTEWILSRGFPSSLRAMGTPLVAATVELYEVLVENLKPSPEKSHYTFNMRDVSKVFQGIGMVHAPRITDDKKMAELWMHEVWRAFADRFTEDQDSAWFAGEASRICNRHFKVSLTTGMPAPTSGTKEDPNAALNRRRSSGTVAKEGGEPPLLFASVTNDEGNYEKIKDMREARQILEAKMEQYNIQSRTGELNLVIFGYVLEHVTRISRVLKQPGGNLLLVGVGGSGRRSCTKLAAYVQECDYSTITVAKDYDHSDFLDDIRQLLLKTGQKGYSTAFVLSDSEITSDVFLEDVCSLLNSGEVPGLWDTKQDKETYENAVASLREVGKTLGRPDTQEALQTLFLERCRKHMHIVLCFSPLGSVLRERLRKFPSLVNCTTIDWFREWPEDGLRSVATRFLRDLDLTDDEKISIREMFVTFQQQIRDMGATYLAEARQHTYVTPTSYLDLLGTFARLLQAKRSELTAKRQRYVNGLAQLKKTEDQVEVMQKELEVMRPELAKKQTETDRLIAQVEQESKLAEEQRAIVAVDEAAANEQAAAAKTIKDASQEKVDEAQPLVEQAQRAVLDLDPKALQEVKALKTPPQGVKYVIEVLCTLLGGVYKPKPVRDPLTGKTNIPYWEHAKLTLLTGDFKNILLNAYPEIVDNAPDSQIEEVKKKMSNDMFKMENIRKTSVALVGVATYIKAVVEYYKQNKVIKPLLAQAAAAQAEYDHAMEGLNKKKEELRVINEKLQALTDHLASVNKDKQALEDKVNDTDTKLTRAKKLIEGLGGEKTRFAKEAERFAEELKYVVGNVVVSSGVIAYLGPFLAKYRQQAVASWVQMCKDSGILVSEDFSLESFCGDPVSIQEWKLQQLPSDNFSINNAVIMRNSSRWPLLVDPQQQANNWIKNMERENNLVVVRPSEADFLRTIRMAITQGHPVLLENVEETIDPMLENLLLKRLTREGTMRVMHLGEPVEWNDNFRFYMTTKLPRPHYLPEVSTKVTLINFMITEQGLCDQLLQRVMMSERRDVEEKKQALTLEAAANQAGLKNTEDKILAILSAEGNILESEEAIEELDRSKEQSDRIAKRQEEIEAMERISDRTRNQFVPVAHLGAILFFCVTELANVDPMYQNSLQFYISVFQEALMNSEKSTEVPVRIENISNTFKTSLYQRICRSLFAKDQLLFSFIMSLKMFAVDPTLLRWLLMGGFETDANNSEMNAIAPFDWLPAQNWTMLRRAATQLSLCAEACSNVPGGLLGIVRSKEMFFRDFYESSNPLELEFPAPLNTLTTIEKMVLVRCFRTDKIVPAVGEYVRETLGESFVQAPLFVLETVVDELAYDPSIPVILVLSPGADPNAELDRVAELKGMLQNRLFKLSLGQGQDVPAKELIDIGMREGHWVLLQNCHLYEDFMPTLSRLIETYSDKAAKEKLHKDFRLWLTSLPSETFPIAILQNGVKLVQEPPKGLKNNLLQSYLSDPVADMDFFTSSTKPEAWRKMLFGLCFFHAVVQERRQYGPLGWNRPYEFNDTDRRISVRQLNMFLNENEAIPYDALLYLIGQCNYGGRVTDDWDRRCLMATLQVFFTPLILDDEYSFNDDAQEYYAPPFGEYQTYVDYIQALPQQQPPSIFGLHENADITKDERDARFLLDATLSTQPREATTTTAGSGSTAEKDKGASETAGDGGAAAKSVAPPTANAALDPKTTVKQLAAEVLSRLPQLFDVEEVQKAHPIKYEQSMNTVLLQEAIRYNRLLDVVRRSLVDVQDAISGKVVMSAELEQVFNNMFDGKVPELWKRRSYPSLKPLGAYVNDLVARLTFLRKWCDEGPPPMFWLSGFFFTQSFLTGVMQNYARKHQIEIDKLVWDFSVMTEDTFTKAPEEGCYVYGLFLEGAGWEDGVLCESKPKELFMSFPVMKLVPSKPEDVAAAPIYHCPCYKTTDRKGVLSTTGHSTNFILTVDLPRDPQHEENHWVLRGAALFTQLDY